MGHHVIAQGRRLIAGGLGFGADGNALAQRSVSLIADGDGFLIKGLAISTNGNGAPLML